MAGMLIYHVHCICVTSYYGRYGHISCSLHLCDFLLWQVCSYIMFIAFVWLPIMAGMVIYHVHCICVTSYYGRYGQISCSLHLCDFLLWQVWSYIMFIAFVWLPVMAGMVIYHVHCICVTSYYGRYGHISCSLHLCDFLLWQVWSYIMFIAFVWLPVMAGMVIYHVHCICVTSYYGRYGHISCSLHLCDFLLWQVWSYIMFIAFVWLPIMAGMVIYHVHCICVTSYYGRYGHISCSLHLCDFLLWQVWSYIMFIAFVWLPIMAGMVIYHVHCICVTSCYGRYGHISCSLHLCDFLLWQVWSYIMFIAFVWLPVMAGMVIYHVHCICVTSCYGRYGHISCSLHLCDFLLWQVWSYIMFIPFVWLPVMAGMVIYHVHCICVTSCYGRYGHISCSLHLCDFLLWQVWSYIMFIPFVWLPIMAGMVIYHVHCICVTSYYGRYGHISCSFHLCDFLLWQVWSYIMFIAFVWLPIMAGMVIYHVHCICVTSYYGRYGHISCSFHLCDFLLWQVWSYIMFIAFVWLPVMAGMVIYHVHSICVTSYYGRYGHISCSLHLCDFLLWQVWSYIMFIAFVWLPIMAGMVIYHVHCICVTSYYGRYGHISCSLHLCDFLLLQIWSYIMFIAFVWLPIMAGMVIYHVHCICVTSCYGRYGHISCSLHLCDFLLWQVWSYIMFIPFVWLPVMAGMVIYHVHCICVTSCYCRYGHISCSLHLCDFLLWQVWSYIMFIAFVWLPIMAGMVIYHVHCICVTSCYGRYGHISCSLHLCDFLLWQVWSYIMFIPFVWLPIMAGMVIYHVHSICVTSCYGRYGHISCSLHLCDFLLWQVWSYIMFIAFVWLPVMAGMVIYHVHCICVTSYYGRYGHISCSLHLCDFLLWQVWSYIMFIPFVWLPIMAGMLIYHVHCICVTSYYGRYAHISCSLHLCDFLLWQVWSYIMFIAFVWLPIMAGMVIYHVHCICVTSYYGRYGHISCSLHLCDFLLWQVWSYIMFIAFVWLPIMAGMVIYHVHCICVTSYYGRYGHISCSLHLCDFLLWQVWSYIMFIAFVWLPVMAGMVIYHVHSICVTSYYGRYGHISCSLHLCDFLLWQVWSYIMFIAFVWLPIMAGMVIYHVHCICVTSYYGRYAHISCSLHLSNFGLYFIENNKSKFMWMIIFVCVGRWHQR